MRFIIVLLVAMLLGMTSNSAHAQTDAFDRYDQLLAAYVRPAPDGITRVAYAQWAANPQDRAALDAVIAEMAARRPSQMNRADAFAAWANLYNAITLKVILDRHPVRSIRQIRSRGTGLDPAGLIGPWKEKRVTVEGRRLSLDDIEHDILRPTFQDPRVHYAVNCASIGCPNLKTTAWRGATLEADLDAAARAFINHPRGVQVLPNGAVRASTIYSWFSEDFGADDAAVIAHLRAFAAPPLAAQLAGKTRIAGYDYDWALNGAP